MESLDGVEDWLARLSPDGTIVVGALRRLITEAAPGAREIVYHDALGYGPTDKGFDRVFYISAFKDHINLGFFYGAGLDDPDALLAGSGKQMRHLKIRSSDSMPNAAIRQLLELGWPVGLARVQEQHRSKRRESPRVWTTANGEHAVQGSDAFSRRADAEHSLIVIRPTACCCEGPNLDERSPAEY